MPSIALESKVSTGHDCFPPVPAVGPYTTKSFINGLAIQLKDVTRYQPHTCGRTTHSGGTRLVIEGSSTFFLEGKAVARIGDSIACGDAVSEGSSNSFIG
jgi:uncharacterized Zn-binding protein involved in type VI secretion